VRLPRCRLINAAESRPTSAALSSPPPLSLSRVLSSHLILCYRRWRWPENAMAMAQSPSPLAKLKYLAFGCVRKRLHDQSGDVRLCELGEIITVVDRATDECKPWRVTRGAKHSEILLRNCHVPFLPKCSFRISFILPNNGSRVSVSFLTTRWNVIFVFWTNENRERKVSWNDRCTLRK